MSKFYLERKRLENSPKGKYLYTYLVQCPECQQTRWTKSYPTKSPRCSSCAGRISYTPSKVSRTDERKRGEGYITKQGYLLVYDGSGYVPAHHIVLKPKDPKNVIHHIDGDKLNNLADNLVELTKAEHRKAHASLEQLGYLLIQQGLINYDMNTNSYNLSRALQKCIVLNPVNSGEPLTDDAEGNPEPSLVIGRCNDYPKGEYIKSLMEAQDTLPCKDEGEDIVCSVEKSTAELECQSPVRAWSNDPC